MKKRMFILLIILSFSLLGCSGEKSNQANGQIQTNEEEILLDEALVEQGEKIAKSSCIGCHGVDLKGDMGPNLHGLHLSKEQIIDVLIKGRGSMPPASASGKEEAVAEYLLSLKN